MGQSVKLLVDHLRQREEEFGVNAFKFNRISVSGLQDLQPAQYPPEADEVIAAGKSVKNWPRAADIFIGPSLMRIDEEADIGVDNKETNMSRETLSTDEPIQATDVPMSPPAGESDTADIPMIQEESHGTTPNLDGVFNSDKDLEKRLTKDSYHKLTVPTTVIPTDDPVSRAIETSGSGPPSEPVMNIRNTADDRPVFNFTNIQSTDIKPLGVHQPITGPINGNLNSVTPFNFNTAVANQTQMWFPPHPGGIPYYIPSSQDMRGHPGQPQLSSTMGHPPFMGHLGQEQWGMMPGYPYFSGQNYGGPSRPDDLPKDMSGSPKHTIDPSLPPGPPPFSIPFSQTQGHFSGQPLVSHFQGNSFLMSNGTPASAFAHPSSSTHISALPNVNILPTPMDTTMIIPPKGTPSPKKSSPRKRGRATVDEAVAKTPSRNRKRNT